MTNGEKFKEVFGFGADLLEYGLKLSKPEPLKEETE